MKNALSGRLWVVAASIIMQSAAFSSTITVAVDPTPPGRYLSPIALVLDGTSSNEYAGIFRATINGQNTVDVMCVDVFTNINAGTVYQYLGYHPNDPTAQAYSVNLGRAAWLFLTYMPVVNSASTASLRAIDGAALQIAIWDVVHDGGDGLSAGRIRSASNQGANSVAAYNQAATWISASYGKALNAATIMINAGGPSQMQTLISYDGVLTPEPGTVMCGVVLAAFILRRTRVNMLRALRRTRSSG